MKISVITPTYNREQLLKKLYKSLIENKDYDIEIEWIVSDDGSNDNTKELINSFIDENMIEIKYFNQQNQGKMAAINNVINYSSGDLIIECDSDDYFTEDAFKIIKEEYDLLNEEEILNSYGLCFLKYDQNNKNMGNNLKKRITTMFDLYFKEGETGEKLIVFIAEKRKKYKYIVEKGERFSTEARMFHKMDKEYKLICINKKVMFCEYQNEGYTKNIKKQFLENPLGYYNYFKEMFDMDMKGIKFNKRLYIIKHYILFSVLIRDSITSNNDKKDKLYKEIKENKLRNVNGFRNKFIYLLLVIPGIIKSKKYSK